MNLWVRKRFVPQGRRKSFRLSQVCMRVSCALLPGTMLSVLRGVLVAILVVSTACSDGAGIKIGLIADLTGYGAEYGILARNGIYLALREINTSSETDNRVQFVLADAGSDRKQALAAARKLIHDDVEVIVMATTSGEVSAVSALCERERVVLFSPTASSGRVTDAGDYVFRNRLSWTQEASAIAQYAVTELGIKTAGLALIDDSAGRRYGTAFRTAFEGAGGRVVDTVWHAPLARDYRSQLQYLMNKREIEAVFVGSSHIETGRLIRQATEMGFRPKWLSIRPVESDWAVHIAGDSLLGVLYARETVDATTGASEAFARKYHRRFGNAAQLNYAVNAYDAAKLLSRLLRDGNTGPEIRDRLYRLQYSGLAGRLAFDSNGDARKRILVEIREFSKGEFHVVKPLFEALKLPVSESFQSAIFPTEPLIDNAERR